MRSRAAYTTFEQTVMALYEKRTLTLDLLDLLAKMYQGIAVDSAGSKNLRASDGKDMQQVCIALVDPAFALVERGACNDNDEYWEQELNTWSHIISNRWGWR